MLAVQIVLQVVWQIGILLYSPVFWLAVLIVFWQIRQRARLKQEFFQLRREPIGKSVCVTVVAGMVGGALASGILLLLGVSVDQIGFAYLWIFTLLMMFIRQRFLCFAYSGGMLAIIHYLTGWPNMEAAQLLALVAVLHFTEAFLVLTTGHLNALPIYLYEPRKQVTGAFMLQMAWPLPVVMLSGIWGTATLPQAGFMMMPDWWPVLGSTQAGSTMTALYMLLPVLAALGYSDLVVSHGIRQKTRQSAMLLFAYSTILLVLVLLTKEQPFLQLIPALFAPFGHEAIIQYGKQKEMLGESHFVASDRGVLILDVQHGSPAARAGLRSEDWIYQLNGDLVENRQAFLRQQYLFSGSVTVTYLRKGRKKRCRMQMGRWSQPGIITAPDQQCSIYWNLKEDTGFANFLYKKLVKTLKKL